MSMPQPLASKHQPLLGCIADDVTGATDLALNLVLGGMRVVQILGVPDADMREPVGGFDAIVVALKTRSIPKRDATELSLAALDVLRQWGVERFYFKYCSTFDSTQDGNIGPVAEAMLDDLDLAQTLFCPAFPRAGRTVYQGHLFVGEKLLCESGMENHPLHPMHDANLVRFLSQQVSRDVGLLPYSTVTGGADQSRAKLVELADNGVTHVVTDTCDDAQLEVLAEVATAMPLVTGGSGLARFLPAAYRTRGMLGKDEATAELPNVAGRSAIIAGSCSGATRAQVQWMQDRCPTWMVDVPSVLSDEPAELQRLKAWAAEPRGSSPVLIASTASPETVADLQNQFGRQRVATAIEHFLSAVAGVLVNELGVRRLILAGGETSGAIVSSLDVRALKIGAEICTGVPWTETIGRQPPMALALKSGNFGKEDFFSSALEMLA